MHIARPRRSRAHALATGLLAAATIMSACGDGDQADRSPSSAEVGQTVQITVTSDPAQEVHVHGFDRTLDLEAGVPGTLALEVTDTPGPGLYEVELEAPGLLLFQLEVR